MAELTAKQERFCQLYATTRNAAESYRQAYNVSAGRKQENVSVDAAALMRDPQISLRIQQIIDEATAQTEGGITVAQIQQMLSDIIMADPDELIGLRVGCCRHCWGVGHKYQWREHEYMEALAQAERLAKREPDTPLPDPSGGLDFNHTLAPNDACPECRGEGVERIVARDTSKLSPGAKLLYGGLKRKQGGAMEITIASKERAIENLARMLGGFKDNVKVSGALAAASALVRLETTDPNEAAKAYQDFIAGHLRA